MWTVCYQQYGVNAWKELDDVSMLDFFKQHTSGAFGVTNIVVFSQDSQLSCESVEALLNNVLAV